MRRSSRSATGRKTSRPLGLREQGRRGPLQPQTLDQQPCARALQQARAGLDHFAGCRVLTPVWRDETTVLRQFGARREDGRRRCCENSRRPLVAVGFGQRVVDVEEVELQRGVTARGRPPGEPGEEAVAVQGHPGPVGAAASVCEVVGQFVVQDVGEPAEEFDVLGAGQRSVTHRCQCQVNSCEGVQRSGPGRTCRSGAPDVRTDGGAGHLPIKPIRGPGGFKRLRGKEMSSARHAGHDLPVMARPGSVGPVRGATAAASVQ